MKYRNFLLLSLIIILVSSCNSNVSTSTSESSSSSSSITSSSSSSKTSTSTGKTKHTVKAHTLKDSNPPIDVNSKGQVVNENTWESFRNATSSKFNGNYNFTYTFYSGGSYGIQAFTKNGYYISSSSGSLYYERKSGSSFYQYSLTNEGYQRSETTLNIQDKYTSIIKNEIYVHMFDFSNYEYDDYDGTYRYLTASFGSNIKFQGGYLTYLHYALGTNSFDISLSFETEIKIPESYYYA